MTRFILRRLPLDSFLKGLNINSHLLSQYAKEFSHSMADTQTSPK